MGEGWMKILKEETAAEQMRSRRANGVKLPYVGRGRCMMRVLIAEDDRALRSYLERSLERDGYEIELAEDGEAAVASLGRFVPDLLLLDIELPRRHGLEVLEFAHVVSPCCRILVLSGRADAEMRTRCLSLGADDCLAKPFSLAELRARCAALLRRRDHSWDESALSGLVAAGDRDATRREDRAPDRVVLGAGALVLHRLDRTVRVNGDLLSLTGREFSLLEHLLLSEEVETSRRALLAAVWGEEMLATNALDVHLGSLRRKLGAAGAGIEITTIRGSGFRLRPTVQAWQGQAQNLAWPAARPARLAPCVREGQR